MNKSKSHEQRCNPVELNLDIVEPGPLVWRSLRAHLEQLLKIATQLNFLDLLYKLGPLLDFRINALQPFEQILVVVELVHEAAQREHGLLSGGYVVELLGSEKVLVAYILPELAEIGDFYLVLPVHNDDVAVTKVRVEHVFVEGEDQRAHYLGENFVELRGRQAQLIRFHEVLQVAVSGVLLDDRCPVIKPIKYVVLHDIRVLQVQLLQKTGFVGGVVK